jgi:hypothetical protein
MRTLFNRFSRNVPLFLFCCLLTVVAQKANSQDSTSASKVEVSGFVDAYYSKNFAQPSTRVNKLRNFDIAENQFNLSLAELVVQKKAGPVGFRFDLDFGSTNDLVQPGNASTMAVLQQGYFTTVIPVGEGLTVDAGKFVTHMGNEVIESKDNWNYSRSYLFAWAIPYYHTGIRLMYPVSNGFTAGLHVVNGWNSGADNNDFKSLGLTLNYALTGSTGLIVNAMDGFDNLTSIENGKRTVFDFIITHQLTESFTLVLNADYGQAGTTSGLAIWKGAALYGRYVINPKYAVALRGEIFDDPQGYATGLGTFKLDVKEVTGTYEYKFADALVLRGELRYDFSNAPAFDKKADATTTGVGTESNQLTVLLGGVVTF